MLFWFVSPLHDLVIVCRCGSFEVGSRSRNVLFFTECLNLFCEDFLCSFVHFCMLLIPIRVRWPRKLFFRFCRIKQQKRLGLAEHPVVASRRRQVRWLVDILKRDFWWRAVWYWKITGRWVSKDRHHQRHVDCVPTWDRGSFNLENRFHHKSENTDSQCWAPGVWQVHNGVHLPL